MIDYTVRQLVLIELALMPLHFQSDTRHSKLMRSIINKDNPFAKMTEKDMLIFNPNYHAFLKKLKNKEAHSSELSRIMS